MGELRRVVPLLSEHENAYISASTRPIFKIFFLNARENLPYLPYGYQVV